MFFVYIYSMIERAERIPLPGEIYEHYKGGTYEIVTMSVHTETQERLVIYKSLNFGTVYARPLEIFNSTVKKFGNKINITRFSKIR